MCGRGIEIKLAIDITKKAVFYFSTEIKYKEIGLHKRCNCVFAS